MLQRLFARFSDEKLLFLLVASVFGLFNIIASPPFQVPDEFNHVHRVMQIASGEFMPAKQGAAAGGFVSRGVLRQMKHYEILPKRPEIQIVPAVIWNDFNTPPKDAEGRVFQDFNNTAIHIPVVYLPQVVGFMLTGFVTDNFMIRYYLVRVLMLGLYILVGYLCLAWLPVAKKSFLVFLTLPMSLFIHASFSADYFLNLVYLVLAVMLARHALCEDAGRKERVWIALCAFLAGFLKAAYAPLMLAILILWSKGERKPSDRRLFFVSAALFIVSAGAAFWFTQRNYYKMLDFVDPVAQMKFILSHPLEFAWILMKSAVVKFPFIPVGLATQMGWQDVFIPWYVALASIAVFFYTTIVDAGDRLLTRQQRLLFIAAAFLCMLSVHFFLYLSWNPVGEKIISGMQGRYMFPAIGFVLLALVGLIRRPAQFRLAFAAHTAILIYSEIFMFFRYYKVS